MCDPPKPNDLKACPADGLEIIREYPSHHFFSSTRQMAEVSRMCRETTVF